MNTPITSYPDYSELRTLQYYRRLFLDEGLETMVHALRSHFPHSDKARFKGLIQCILYGADRFGNPLDKPLPATPGLDPFEYEFRGVVFEKWIQSQRQVI